MSYDYRKLKEQAIREGKEQNYYEDTHDPLIPKEAWENFPEYFTTHLKEKNEKVNKLLSEIKNPEAFIFFADTHIRQNRVSSIHIIRSILENTKVKTVLYGGDTVSGYADEEMLHEDIKYFNEAYKFANMYPARGNHDIYGKPFEIANVGYVLSNEQVYNYIFKDIQHKVKGVEGKTYYYFEHEDTKVRYIVIDTNETLITQISDNGVWDLTGISFSNEQLEWFVNTLLSTPEDYKIIIMGHIPPNDKLLWSYPLCHVFSEIIDAYNLRMKKTCVGNKDGDHIEIDVDFTDAKSQAVLYVCGHGHVDDLYMSDSGCSYYEIHTDSMCDNGGSPYKKTVGTVTESALDVIIYDRDTGKIQSIRYGAGVDRILRNTD